MLALVRVELAARVQHVGASGADAMDVVAHLGEAAAVEVAVLVLHELFEAVAAQLFVLDVVTLVLFCSHRSKHGKHYKHPTICK